MFVPKVMCVHLGQKRSIPYRKRCMFKSRDLHFWDPSKRCYLVRQGWARNPAEPNLCGCAARHAFLVFHYAHCLSFVVFIQLRWRQKEIE